MLHIMCCQREYYVATCIVRHFLSAEIRVGLMSLLRRLHLAGRARVCTLALVSLPCSTVKQGDAACAVSCPPLSD